MRGHAERLSENMCKMISAQLNDICKLAEGNFLREMCFDKFDDQLLLSGRQATVKRCLVQAVALRSKRFHQIGKRIIAIGAAIR